MYPLEGIGNSSLKVLVKLEIVSFMVSDGHKIRYLKDVWVSDSTFRYFLSGYIECSYTITCKLLPWHPQIPQNKFFGIFILQ